MCLLLQLVSVGVDDPMPAIQDVTLSNVVGGTFTLRVMADALGGEIDEETAEIGYSASAAAVELALEAASSTLGAVQVTKTTSGEMLFLVLVLCRILICICMAIVVLHSFTLCSRVQSTTVLSTRVICVGRFFATQTSLRKLSAYLPDLIRWEMPNSARSEFHECFCFLCSSRSQYRPPLSYINQDGTSRFCFADVNHPN